MTTQLGRPGTTTTPAPRRERTGPLLAGMLVVCLFIAWVIHVAHNARTGAVADRIRNPGVTGAPRPVAVGWGDWQANLKWEQIGTAIALAIMLTAFVFLWRRSPWHPALLMAFCCTFIVWLDPLMNWAPYAVYNPQLWHFPETWWWFKLSPTVEPFVVLGYVAFYFGPYLPAIWVLRRLQRGRGPEAFVWKHPLIALGALAFVIGFVYDAFLEVSMVRSGLYIYSQVIPFGSISTGSTYQFPLIWESSLVCLVMVPAAVLLYRDDTGKTQAEKLAMRMRLFRGRPHLGTLAVMLILINVAYLLYGGGFYLIKLSGRATSVACPYPYPEAKVFDPQGMYEKNGQPGPSFRGVLSTWANQHVAAAEGGVAADGGRCSPTNIK